MKDLRELLNPARFVRPGASADNGPAEPAPDPDCPACGDRGWVRHDFPIGHPLFGKAQPCRQCDLALPQLSPALPWAREGDYAFERLIGQGAAVRKLTAWLDGRANARPWLAFSGPTGTGKTYLATIAGFRLTRVGLAVRLGTAKGILGAIKRTFDDPEASAEQVIGDIASAPALIIDDLGAENATNWATSEILDIVDHRYAARALTIFTTNLRPAASLKGRLWSRVFGDLTLIAVTSGPDRRIQQT